MNSSTSYLSSGELNALGFRSLGRNVRVSRLARFYGASRIDLGDEVRIDDFAVLSAGEHGIRLFGYNHLGVGALVFGDLELGEWSTLSSRVAVYSKSDDFTKVGHTYPHADGRNLVDAPVVIGHRSVIGTGSTILPGVQIGDDVAVGAMTLVNRSLESRGLFVGIPARLVRTRTSE